MYLFMISEVKTHRNKKNANYRKNSRKKNRLQKENIHKHRITMDKNTEKEQKNLTSCPADCRHSPAEAPQIGKIHPFSKINVNFEPLMGF